MHFQPHWRQHGYIALKMMWWASFCLVFSSPRELPYSAMSERDTLWCAITNQNVKSQGSNLYARLHSLFRKPKLLLVHCNIHSYKPATSGGPAEPSLAMLENPDPGWKCSSHPSQGKPPQNSKARAFASTKDQVLLPKSNQTIHKKWMLNRWGFDWAMPILTPYSAASSWSNT